MKALSVRQSCCAPSCAIVLLGKEPFVISQTSDSEHYRATFLCAILEPCMLEHSQLKNKWLFQQCDRICNVMSYMSVKQKLLSHSDKCQHVQVAGYHQEGNEETLPSPCPEIHPVPMASLGRVCVRAHMHTSFFLATL